MRQKKKSLWFMIVLLLLFLGIGYAYLSTTLSINGTTDIDSNTWDVYFDNVNVTSGSVSGEQEIEAPTITSDTTVEYHVRLKEPGEFYEFTIDVKNDGTIDAMIETITKKVNGGTTIPAYLNYTVTYSDDLEIEDNHLLAAESLETYKVRIEYRTDIDPSDLPSTAQNLSLSFGVEYVQSDSSVQSVGHIEPLYYTGSTEILTGETVSNGVTLYSTSEEAMAAFSNRPFYLKYIIIDNIVNESYVDFVITDEMASSNTNATAGKYSLRGGDSTYFTDNMNILSSAFGEENCGDGSAGYTCELSDLYAIVDFQGKVSVGIDNNVKAYCTVNHLGYSECYAYS